MLRTRRQELEAAIKNAYAELESLDRKVPGVVESGNLAQAQTQTAEYQTDMCARAESPEEAIDYLFTFHDDPDKTPHYVEIREAAKQFAKVILRHTPGGGDRMLAIQKVREAVMFANACVALSGRA
jgi:hypothetical protein